MIIDTHCHFDMITNPESHLKRWEQNGNIIIGMTNSPQHFRIGHPHVLGFKHIRLALGFHPQLATDNYQELSLFKSLFSSTSYIGEVGLDFSKDFIHSKDVQLSSFAYICECLRGQNKIVSVHSRKGEVETLNMLKEYSVNNVIFHWYSGPLRLIEEIVAAGYYFSVNEAMTISESGRKIISRIPLDRILTESDAPFNRKSNIKNALTNLGISEYQIYNNFQTLLNRIK